MNLFRIISFLLVIGLIYRVVSRFIFPAVNITSATNDRLRQMQDQLNEMNRKASEAAHQKPAKKAEGDYIDYEEVKP
jgi:hypothetical protein